MRRSARTCCAARAIAQQIFDTAVQAALRAAPGTSAAPSATNFPRPTASAAESAPAAASSAAALAGPVLPSTSPTSASPAPSGAPSLRPIPIDVLTDLVGALLDGVGAALHSAG